MKRATVVAASVMLAALIVIACVTVARAHVVRHWNLYTSGGSDRSYHLFLGPFVDDRACELDKKAIVLAGGRAYCSSDLTVAFDMKREQQLFWEYVGPGAPWRRICGLPNS